ncbi:class I SAM-dependent methyltransferase [Jannaschia donghaensis]|uniref:Ubiquinone/menaquinone biosynthesis methyltransferase n=1 Tax=Jannaschia donghaensis TaxID=420998 RepID=A0A0M6YMZ2_9RHOB|nr:class I SAM-dependent methyltransferase [Jannaschia donghaensis]CTQ51254.1 ubiquinone/menaquinone biosynthesis methyltransferase [Jannaschia donghaensis]
MTDTSLRTSWTDTVGRGGTPDAAALRDHLRAVHRANPGFTESCAGQCRDAEGRTTYEWLAQAVTPQRHRSVLDLACGSGALLAILNARLPSGARLLGVDMSPDELALARARLPEGRADLIEGRAQHLDHLGDGSVDAVLCHWALTLMDPVAAVLDEIARVLAPGGRFAALVDGPLDAAPGYRAVHDLIYGHVQAALPAYGRIELGDPRVRSADDLVDLARTAFPFGKINIETNVVRLRGSAEFVAREAAGFFYAAFILTDDARDAMLGDLAALLSDWDIGGETTFAMPVNRLCVDLPDIRPLA